MNGRQLLLLSQTLVVISACFAFDATFDLSTLDGQKGAVLDGLASGDATGFSVSGAGDVNGDGLDDFLIGAYWADPNENQAGVVYVVFGLARGRQFPNSFDLSNLNGTTGFVLQGFEEDAAAGISVSTAGDMNGDGVADLIIGAYQANPSGREWAGQAYVVFGRQQGSSFPSTIQLSALNGADGFAINGIAAFDSAGISVASAGDINNDGFDDVLVGAHYAGHSNLVKTGKAFVVYGKGGSFDAQLFLSTLDGTNGFEIQGIGAEDYAGASAAAGDVNSDGVADMIVGAWLAGSGSQGEAYVIFGVNHSVASFPHPLPLSSINGSNGFRITGGAAGDAAGVSVSGAGDVNGDGVGDLIVGAQYADPNGVGDAGAAYIIFGITQSASFPHPFALTSLDGTNGVEIQGAAGNDNAGWSVAAVGDLNGDDIADVAIGAPMADAGSDANTGTAYVVFGVASGQSLPHPLPLSSLDGSNGFAVPGLAAGDFAGFAVGGPGDVNGDGLDDLLVGAYKASPPDKAGAGTVYVVFGALPLTDECALSTHNCMQVCDDTPGSFVCLCTAGYRLQGDLISCADVDECSLATDNCDREAACANTVGSFTCTCAAGTTPNADRDPSSANPGDGSACYPLDECLHALDDCHAQASCNDTVASFLCQCNAGYDGNGVSCSDVQECARNPSPCDVNAQCSNSMGSFTCECNAGYIGSGVVCEDLNECFYDTNNTCHEAAACTNTVGSYTCQCPDGWNDVGSRGENCVNPLACAAPQEATCDANARCDLTAPGASTFDCTCNVGYEGTGEVCTDIDECADGGSNTCHRDAECTNTDGSFFCTCGEFFLDTSPSGGRGLECVFHACEAAEAALCHEFASCQKNRRGEVVCICIEGYVGDGTVCLDRDECGIPELAGNCHPIARCVNTQGSFHCECPQRHLGDGLRCAADAWLVRTVIDLPPGANPDLAALGQQYSSLLLPNGRSAPAELGTVTRLVGQQLTLYESFGAEAEGAEVIAGLSSPQWSSIGGGSVVDGPHLIWWTGNASQSPPPTHMRLLSVDFDGTCNGNQGCWAVGVGYTANEDAMSAVYLPRISAAQRRAWSADMPPSSALHDAAREDAGGTARRTSVPWGALPLPSRFPCESAALNANQPPAASTACCIPSFTSSYRAPSAWGAALASVAGLDLTAPKCFNVSFATAGAASNPAAGLFARPKPLPPLSAGLFADGVLDGLARSSAGARGVLDPLHGDHKTVLLLDEAELATEAGVSLADRDGVVRAVESFVGVAELRPWAGTIVLQPTASQAFLHLERGDGFAVSLESSRPHAPVSYLSLRLVEVQELGSSAPAAHVAQVTWYLDEAFRAPTDAMVPLASVHAGFGSAFADPTARRRMARVCSEFAACRGGTCRPAASIGVFGDEEYASFTSRVGQQCASHAHIAMCGGESGAPALQGRFASFNVPLGVGRLPPLSSGQKMLVRMRVRMRSNSGQYVEESELRGSVDVSASNIHRICSAPSSAASSLADVARAELLVGAVGAAAQWEAIVKSVPGSGLRSDVDAQQAPQEITGLGIEFAVLTMVAEGTGSVFGASVDAPAQGIALEDTVSVHILEVRPPDGAAATGPKADAVKALLAQGAPADTSDAPEGASFLSAAFYVLTDEQRGRARLHPSSQLLSLCSANPPASTERDMFPESCVLRRDVEDRVAAPTALELPRPGLGGAITPAPLQDEEQLGTFMASLLGENANARQLAANWTRLMHDRYALDGVSSRAWWINPGYTWAPRGAQAGEGAMLETQFDLSQTVFLVSLLTLDQSPGVDGRRVLLASLPSGPPATALSAATLAFPTSPAQVVAKEVNIPVRQVSTWSFRMGLSWEEQCDKEREAKLSLIDKIWAATEGTASTVLTVQIPTIRRSLVDTVCCPVLNCTRDAERRDGHGGSPDAYADLGVVIAHSGSAPFFYVEEVARGDGIQSIDAVDVHESIRLTRPGAAAADEEDVETGWRYWTQHTAFVATICTLTALGCLLCMCFGWWWKRRQDRRKAEEKEEEQPLANSRAVNASASQLVVKNGSPFPLVLPQDDDEETKPVAQSSGLDLMIYGKPATLKDTAAGPAKVKYTKGPEVL